MDAVMENNGISSLTAGGAEGHSSTHLSCIKALKYTNESLSFSLSVSVFVEDLVMLSTE